MLQPRSSVVMRGSPSMTRTWCEGSEQCGADFVRIPGHPGPNSLGSVCTVGIIRGRKKHSFHDGSKAFARLLAADPRRHPMMARCEGAQRFALGPTSARTLLAYVRIRPCQPRRAWTAVPARRQVHRAGWLRQLPHRHEQLHIGAALLSQVTDPPTFPCADAP